MIQGGDPRATAPAGPATRCRPSRPQDGLQAGHRSRWPTPARRHGTRLTVLRGHGERRRAPRRPRRPPYQYSDLGNVTRASTSCRRLDDVRDRRRATAPPTRPLYIVQGDDHGVVTALVPSSAASPSASSCTATPARYTVAWPAPDHVPLPDASRTIAVCSSSPTSTASAGWSSSDRSRRWSAAPAWSGNTATPRDHAEPDRVGAAARIDHRVAHARSRPRPTPRSPRPDRARRAARRTARCPSTPSAGAAASRRRGTRTARRASRRRSRRPRRRGGSAPGARSRSRPGPGTTPPPARRRAPGARTRPRSAGSAPRRTPARCSRWLSSPRHGSVHSPPPSSAIAPAAFFIAADPTVRPARSARHPRRAGLAGSRPTRR